MMLEELPALFFSFFFCNYNANFDWLSDSLLLANMPQEIIIDSVIKMQIIASLERKTAGRRKKYFSGNWTNIS